MPVRPVAPPTADPGAQEQAVRQALAVPTRAAIHRLLCAGGGAYSAREVGARIGIHANVARAHLDVLVDAGLAMAGSRHNPSGGRPAKVYVAREQLDASVHRPLAVPSGAVLGLRTVLRLVGGVRENVARIERLAEDQGRRLVDVFGGRAAARTFDAAMHVTVEALRSAFPGVHVRLDDKGACVLEGVRVDLAVIGEVDEQLADALAVGIVRGALATAGARADVEVAQGSAVVRPAADDAALQSLAPSVDVRGVTFDRGIIHATRAIDRLRPGAHLEVLADDSVAPGTIVAWADRAGLALIAVDRIRDPDGRSATRIIVRCATVR